MARLFGILLAMLLVILAPDGARAGPYGTPGSFAVNAFGAATYAFPIRVAPGSAGMTPSLSLNYSSQSGGGLLGVGWSVGGLSAITRCPTALVSDGTPGTVSLAMTDQFCLDGQRLMAISGGYGQNGTEYRTELQSFTKIVSYGSNGNGPEYFIAWTKSGEVLEFGNTTASYYLGSSSSDDAGAIGTRMLTPATSSNPGTAIFWNLSKRSDKLGNYIQYSYNQNWWRDPGTGTWYLRSLPYEILYTGNAAAGHGPYARVSFHYEPRVPSNTVKERAEAFVGGFVLMDDARISAIVSSVTVGGTDQVVRAYTLQYDAGGARDRSRLMSIQECARTSVLTYYSGYCADAPPDEKDVPTSFTYFNGLVSQLTGFAPASSTAHGAYAGWTPVLGDFDGDGKSDVLWYDPGNSLRRLWLGIGPDNTAQIGNVASYDGNIGSNYKVVVMDVDSDGRSDVVFYPHTMPVSGSAPVFTWVSQGGGNFSVLAQTLSVRPDMVGFTYHVRPLIGDFTGDGRGDIVWDLQSATYPVGSAGARILWSGVGNGQFTQSTNFAGLDGTLVGFDPQVGDFNGDGVADIFWTSVYADGGSSGTRKVWIGTTGGSVRQVDNLGGYDGGAIGARFNVVDLNSDSKSDLFMYTATPDGRSSGWYVTWLSRGDDSFELVHGPAAEYTGSGSLNSHFVGAVPTFGDFNGDGVIDILMDTRDGTLRSTTSRWFLINSGNGRHWQVYFNAAGANGNAMASLPLILDADGDGKSDVWLDVKVSAAGASQGDGLLLRNSFGVTGTSAQTGWPTVGPVHGASDLLFQVLEGSGRQHQAEYSPLTRAPYPGFYDRSPTPIAAFPYVTLTLPMQAVTFSGSSNGLGADLNLQAHWYQDAVFHLWGRGFQGFALTAERDYASRTQVNVRREVQWPYSGMAGLTEKYWFDASWNPYTVGRSVQYLNNLPYTGPGPAITQRWPYVEHARSTTWELDGSFKSQALTSNTFDIFGNATQVVVLDENAANAWTGHRSVAYAEFEPAINNGWLIARQKCAARTSTIPGGAHKTRTVAYSTDSTTGLVTQEVIEPGVACGAAPGVETDARFRVHTTYQYDEYGNVGQLTRAPAVSSGHPAYFAPRTETSDYKDSGNTAKGRYLISRVNALGQQVFKDVYDFRTARRVSRTVDGLTTQWGYSPLGRLTSETQPDSTVTNWTYDLCTVPLCGSYWLGRGYVVNTTTSGQPSRRAFHDSLDRAWRRWTVNDGNTAFDLRGGWDFNAAGQVATQYDPCTTVCSSVVTTTYDGMGRPLVITDQLGKLTSFQYSGAWHSVTNSRGHLSRRYFDTLGRVVTVVQAEGVYGQQTALSMGYDEFGNVNAVTSGSGVARSAVFDIAGRKTSSSDPDMGNWTYDHDALGQPKTQTDAAGQTQSFDHDLLGRLVQRAEPSLISYFAYDTSESGCAAGGKVLGKRTRAWTSTGGERKTCFDSLGRNVNETVSDGVVTTSIGRTYDGYGRLATETYSNGVGLVHGYSATGYLGSVGEAGGTNRVLWQSLSRDAAGRVVDERIGGDTIQPGTKVHREYNVRGGLELVKATPMNGSTELANQVYGYDDNRNLDSRQWWDGAATRNESFVYDAHDRLTDVIGPASKTFAYDPEGNLTGKDGQVLNYPVPTAPRPHAVSNVTGTINGVANPSYEYDSNGNLLKECPGGNCASPSRQLTWASHGLPTQIVRGTSTLQFGYGPDRERLRQTATVGGVTTTIRYGAGGMEQTEVAGQTERKVYLQVEGRLVASVNVRSSGPTEYRYFVTDGLGSPAVMLNDQAQVVEREGFDAWGKRRNVDGTDNAAATSAERHGYTGHEHLDPVGMIHMNGRVYDPGLGRFVSADPIVQSPHDLQSYNRYSYVRGNPLTMTDPSGYFSLRKLLNADPVLRPVVGLIDAGNQLRQGNLGQSLLTLGHIAPGQSSIDAYLRTHSGAATVAMFAGNVACVAAGPFAPACAAGVSAYATANFGGSNAEILQSAAVAGVSAAAYAQIDAGYGNAWSWSRVGLTATVGGATAAASDADARLGFWRTFGIASLTYANVAMRRYEIDKILSDRTGFSWEYNLIGESAGFYDGYKLAGTRCYAAGIVCLIGKLGGVQASQGSIFGVPYAPGGVVDRIIETFAGPHDFLNDMAGSYTAVGFNLPDTSFTDAMNWINLIPATPFAVAGMVSQTNGYSLGRISCSNVAPQCR